MGRWSRLVAQEFLAWLGAPAELAWLDVGCGTGALSEAIAGRCSPKRLAGVDPAEGFIQFAELRLAGTGAELSLANAMDLPFAQDEFDRAVSGLVLNFVPDPQRAVAEMSRVVRSDGEIAVFVWDYSERMEMLRTFWDVAGQLDSKAAELHEGRRFPICRPKPLLDLMSIAGLADIELRAIEVPMVFRDFNDFWEPFLGGQGPAAGYCMSLNDSAREKLRERLQAVLPAEPDGSIRLAGRAWAVRGTVKKSH
jgi:SAM-dependent methyltransferase